MKISFVKSRLRGIEHWHHTLNICFIDELFVLRGIIARASVTLNRKKKEKKEKKGEKRKKEH